MKKIIFAALLLVANLAMAQMPDLSKGTYVTDFTHVLSDDQVDALNQQIAQIEKASGMQLVVVIIDQLPKGMDVGDFTTAVDLKWQTGNNNPNNNRLIYVAAIHQMMHRLVAVRGTNSAIFFSANKCGEILTAMKPYYKAKDYNSGLQVLVNSVASTMHVVLQPVQQQHLLGFIAGAFAVAIILVLASYFVTRNKKKIAA